MVTNEIVEAVIKELVGEDALPLVEVLRNTSNISEFQIATKIKQPVDIIRNQLYRLYNHNLIAFTRKKDKTKGWYIYYWTLNLERFAYLVIDIKRKRIEMLKNRLGREKENIFFTSDSKCVRVDFEQATQFDFRCPETGELLYQEDNSKIISNIEKELEKLQEEVAEHDRKASVEAATAEAVEESKKKKTTKKTVKKKVEKKVKKNIKRKKSKK